MAACPFCGSDELSEGASDAHCPDCGNSWLVEDSELYDDEGHHAVQRDEVDELIDKLDALYGQVLDDDDDEFDDDEFDDFDWLDDEDDDELR